jgi:hypothetical protein
VAAAVTRAHQRQRGEGSVPVGVSSRTKLSAVWAVTMMMGQDLGQQPVGGIGRGHAAPGQRQAQDQQQPAHRVAGPTAGQHRPDRGRAHRRHPGANGAEGELGQFGSASLARQVVQPGDHWDAEHGQRPQRPRRHTRPPVWSGPSGRKGHGHGPGCMQRTIGHRHPSPHRGSSARTTRDPQPPGGAGSTSLLPTSRPRTTWALILGRQLSRRRDLPSPRHGSPAGSPQTCSGRYSIARRRTAIAPPPASDCRACPSRRPSRAVSAVAPLGGRARQPRRRHPTGQAPARPGTSVQEREPVQPVASAVVR